MAGVTQSALTISRVARTVAERRRLSINAVARRSELAPSTVFNIFSGNQTSVRRLTLIALAHGLGVTPEALCDEETMTAELPPLDGVRASAGSASPDGGVPPLPELPPSGLPSAPPPAAFEGLSPSAPPPALRLRPRPRMGAALYKLRDIARALKGEKVMREGLVPPPPFEEYEGLELSAIIVPAGYSDSLGLENGDVAYICPLAEGSAPPLEGDVVLAELEGRPLPLLLRWSGQTPASVRPLGNVICFARSWV